jgi:hypothetical protein
MTDTDDEWAHFEPFLIRRPPPYNHRRVLDAVFRSMRDLPDVILEALAGSGV